ncbi:phosphoglycerate mutase [Pseudoscardovia radai]|uniref:Phosphoglycerate mutase n=1 Tax=Pseudoscardovia radai TaxID=987066 RepID=A0A261EXD0_9BIFI|nr:histidine phosphatase family protein [Pseudoscardovia radai]OZG51508.1 phosphoglycerate mutase [Pseudoscardovia radai]
MVNLKKIGKQAADVPHVLVLMRHGKAEAMSQGGDAERELTDKGRKQAKRMAKALEEMGLVPDVIASSAATRARQTTDRMLQVFGDKPTVAYHMDLYEGGMQALLDEMDHTKPTHRVLLIVCHEPTVSEAAQWLVDPDQGKPQVLGEMRLGFSPASVAILGSDKPFAEWGLHEGRPLAFVRAGDLD